MTAVDPVAEAALFEVEQPPPVSLADKFGVPPMSVLDRRSGEWAARKRAWLSLGIQSEIGRDATAVGLTRGDDGTHRQDFVARLMRGEIQSGRHIGALLADGVSVFDPVLCELVYRWFSRPGSRVLDPFAGGSVRGVVASVLARWYVGVDLRAEQVATNRAQAHLGSDIAPVWLEGDATRLFETVTDDAFDLVFSCPPYGDLEVYSDDPRDISTWTYDHFRVGHAKAIRDAVGRLRADRYAAWVIGDIRDKRTGAYRGLVGDTIRAFEAAGCVLLNDFVILDQVGAAAIRAERPFVANRKATKVHQNLLVFVKGDIKRAAQWVTA